MSKMRNFRSLLEYYHFHKETTGLTQERLRTRWGLKRQSHVHALLYGKCRPRPALARAIARDTGLDLLTVLNLNNNLEK